MKNKYQRLSKEEQKKALEDYKNRNYPIYKKYKRLRNVCIFGVIYSLFALAVDFWFHYTILKSSFTYNIILDCGVLIFCIFFLVFSKNRLEDLVNKMLVEDLRNKQIEEWKKEENKKNKKKTTTKKTTTKKSTTKKVSKKTKE